MLQLCIGQRLTYTRGVFVGIAGTSAVLDLCVLLDPHERFPVLSELKTQTIYLRPGMKASLLEPEFKLKFEVYYLGTMEDGDAFSEILVNGESLIIESFIRELIPLSTTEAVRKLNRLREILDITNRNFDKLLKFRRAQTHISQNYSAPDNRGGL